MACICFQLGENKIGGLFQSAHRGAIPTAVQDILYMAKLGMYFN